MFNPAFVAVLGISICQCLMFSGSPPEVKQGIRITIESDTSDSDMFH
jgi:hypothetical protein